MAAPKMYRVTAPYITVKTWTQDGPRIIGLHTGAPLPLDATQDSIDHHLRQEMIEEIPRDAARELDQARKDQEDAKERAAEAEATLRREKEIAGKLAEEETIAARQREEQATGTGSTEHAAKDDGKDDAGSKPPAGRGSGPAVKR